MIASAPTIPSSSGVEPGARHGSDRSAASAQSARSFERTLNDARERSDGGPRSERGGEARSAKASADHRSSETTAHAAGTQAADEPTRAATTPPSADADATSGAGSSTDTAAGAAATVVDTATTPVAVAAGAIAGAGLPGLAGPVAGTAGGTTGATSNGAPSAAVAGMPATGTAVLNGVATLVAATSSGTGATTSPTAGAAGQTPASATAPGAPLGLTVTPEATDAPGHGAGAIASSGSPGPAAGPLTAAGVIGVEIGAAGTTTSATGRAGDVSAAPTQAIEPTQPPAAGQLAPAAVATPASTAPAPVAALATAAGSASVPQWLQQAVQAQLTGRLVAAARGSDAGSVQRLTLHLHPADLGAVQVVATLDDGTVSLQLLAGNPATRDALRASLGVLRSDLAAAGLDGTRLDVSDQPPSQQGTPQQQSGGWSDGSARDFTGSAGGAHAMAGGRTDPGQVPSTGGAGARSRPPGRSQGVDLRL